MDSTNNPWSNLFPENNPEAEPKFVDMDEDSPQYPNPIPDSYSSLYEELLSKCDFGNFRDNPEKAKIANDIYAKVKFAGGDSLNRLKEIRNVAIDVLGIKISTEKKYNSLMEYFNPIQYKEPYDKDLIDSAIDFEERTKKNADDIRQLEQIEIEAKPFILKRSVYFGKKSIEYGDCTNAKLHCREATNINKELGADSYIQNQIEEIESRINEIETNSLKEEKKENITAIVGFFLVLVFIILIVFSIGMNK
jgi:hypothetical protein